MRAGIDAACRPGVRAIAGGKLRRQPRHVSFPLAEDHGRRIVSDAVTLTLRARAL